MWSLGLRHGIHVVAGLVFYPLGYPLVAKPLFVAIISPPWWVTGTLYGIALFVFALCFVAHLIAGNPPFLGWGGITWVALWGRVPFGLELSDRRYTDLNARKLIQRNGLDLRHVSIGHHARQTRAV